MCEKEFRRSGSQVVGKGRALSLQLSYPAKRKLPADFARCPRL